MNKVTINTLVSKLDRALTFANDCQKPSAMDCRYDGKSQATRAR